MGIRNAGVSIFAGIPPIPDVPVTGRVFFVGNSSTYVPGGVAGVDDIGGHGDTPYRPFATIDYAIGQCTAGRGDTIYVLPGHAETVAGTIALDVAGVRIIGLGVAANRPTLTFDTTSDVLAVSAANCEIANLEFICNVASLTDFITLAGGADGAYIHHCMFREGSQTGLSMIEWTGAADDVRIEHNTFYAPTAGNYDEAILIASTPTRWHICHNYLYGDWDEGGINNATGNVATLGEISRNQITNLLTNVPAINLDSACTGMISDNYLSTDTYATAIDTGAMRTSGNWWSDATADTGGIPVPAQQVTAGSLGSVPAALYGSGGIATYPAAADPANGVSIAEVLRSTWEKVSGGAASVTSNAILGLKVNKTAATLPASTTQDIFTVSGGRVLVTSLTGEVTTVVQAQVCNLSVVHVTTVGGDITLASTVDINADEAGTLYVVEGDGTALVPQSSGVVLWSAGSGPMILAEGTMNITTSATNTGATAWELWYWPLDSGASVASA